MFRFATVCVLAVIVQNITAITEEQLAKVHERFVEYGAECMKEHPITPEDITAFKEKKNPDGDNAGCFLACVFRKAGVLNDKGTLSRADALAKAKEIIDDEDELKKVEDFYNTCSKVNKEEVSDGEKGCERATLAFNCLVENSDKFDFNLSF